MTVQETCEQRIDEHKAGRLATIAALIKASQDPDVETMTADEIGEVIGYISDDQISDARDAGDEAMREAAQERMYELPLSVETFKTIKVLLSTGGPGDWFEAQIDEDGDILRIEYWFHDWFDSAHCVLNGDEFDTAAEFIRQVAGIE